MWHTVYVYYCLILYFHLDFFVLTKQIEFPCLRGFFFFKFSVLLVIFKCLKDLNHDRLLKWSMRAWKRSVPSCWACFSGHQRSLVVLVMAFYLYCGAFSPQRVALFSSTAVVDLSVWFANSDTLLLVPFKPMLRRSHNF